MLEALLQLVDGRFCNALEADLTIQAGVDLRVRQAGAAGELAATFRQWYPALSLKDQSDADNLLAA